MLLTEGRRSAPSIDDVGRFKRKAERNDMLFSRRSFASMIGSLGRSATVQRAQITVPFPVPRDQTSLVVGLFNDLKSIVVPDRIATIETVGHSRIGIGAARYVSVVPSVTSAFRGQTANGRWFELRGEKLCVEAFGALGDEPGFDDTAGIEAAVAYCEARGGGVVRCEGGKTYHLSRPIAVDPTLVSIDADGATWWFDRGQFDQRSDDPVATSERPCLLVRAKPGSTQYGQARRFCRGLRIVGPTRASTKFDGLVFDTMVNALSSRWALYSCEAAVNLRRGLVLGNRAYLLQAYSCWFSGSTACVETLANMQDAGESIDFYGCTFGNGGVGLKNTGGMEIKLHGGAIDYCRQFFVGGGPVTLFGTHLEMARPKKPDQYPIELTSGGDFTMKGGTVLVTPDGENTYMFFGASPFSRIRLEHVDGYGWPATSGQLMGGQGRLMIDGVWWGSNHQIVPVIKRDATHSLFGAGGLFEGSDLRVGCAVSSPAGTNAGPHLCRSAAGNAAFSASLSLNADQSRSGHHSLRFQKTGWGGGTSTPIMIFAPVARRRMISCEFWHWFSGLPKDWPGGTFWIDLNFAQVLGFDAHQVPIIGQTAACQEIAIMVDASGTDKWTRALLSSAYADTTSPTDGYGPDWTTHLLIAINPVNMPAGFVLHIDDLYGFSL